MFMRWIWKYNQCLKLVSKQVLGFIQLGIKFTFNTKLLKMRTIEIFLCRFFINFLRNHMI